MDTGKETLSHCEPSSLHALPTAWHHGDPSNTELGATKRDNKEADLFQLAESLQLQNLGDVSCSPRQDGWLGMGEVLHLHGTKGLMEMAPPRTHLTCCVRTPRLSVQLPQPPTPIQRRRPVSCTFPACPCLSFGS